MLTLQGAIAPEGAKFTAAKVLRNGGTVLELESAEAAEWVRENAEGMEKWLGGEAKMKARTMRVVAEFVPVTFNPGDEGLIREVETAAGIREGAILSAAWIKPIQRRRKDQKVAFLLIAFRDGESANKAI
ncbi:hypothetical protein LXA43DRAFT_886116, partial [Ganoderma leucocontextum]